MSLKFKLTDNELRMFLVAVLSQEVVINGAAKEIGRAAVIAVTKARGMEVAGAVDSHFVGEDIGKVPFCSFFNTYPYAFHFCFQSQEPCSLSA